MIRLAPCFRSCVLPRTPASVGLCASPAKPPDPSVFWCCPFRFRFASRHWIPTLQVRSPDYTSPKWPFKPHSANPRGPWPA